MFTLSRLAILSAVLTLAIHYQTASAEACSAAPPPQPQRDITPSDGVTGVPLNARLVVHHVATPQEVAMRIELRPEGGAAVDLSIEQDGAFGGELVIATPNNPLLADTVYDIYLIPILSKTCSIESTDCFGDEVTLVSRFTTGLTTDSAAPSFSGAANVGDQGQDTCVNCSCDFDWGTALFDFRWPAASDDTGEVLYNIYSDGVLRNRLRKGTESRTKLVCWGNDVQSGIVTTIAYSAGEYTAVAVDLAGNESANPSPALLPNLDCSAIDDLETDEPPPGTDPDPSDASSANSGCAAGGSRASLSYALAMLVLVVFRRRQRRKA